MSVSLQDLVRQLNKLLKPEQFRDYCPNGLQVEGKQEVTKVISGVTACQALIDAAIEQEADAILVHHGYFWRGEDAAITGMRKTRIQSLLQHEISLIAYHLPLDAHGEYGNNAQLGKLLGIEATGDIGKQNNHPIGLLGELSLPHSTEEFAALLEVKLGRAPVVVENWLERNRPIQQVAWCTGAAQNYIDLAIASGADAYVSGEISEQTVHAAREGGIHYFSAGHHATESYGVQALGDYLLESMGLEVTFVDIPNPV